MAPLEELRLEPRGNVVLAHVKGEVDLSNVRFVKAHLLEAVPNTATALVLDLSADQADRLAGLDEALRRFEAIAERQCRVVECRFFGGMSVEETAAALDVSPRSVKRDWAFARAWLLRELQLTLAGES